MLLRVGGFFVAVGANYAAEHFAILGRVVDDLSLLTQRLAARDRRICSAFRFSVVSILEF